MKLTPNQIDQLYNFTRQHYVEYYDLQTELVDHLANAIEEQWQENSKLSFNDALTIEFKKFGVFGFMDVVNERIIALRKKYNTLIWRHFKEFFKLPKVIITISLIILFLKTAITVEYKSTFIFGFFLLLFIFIISKNILIQKRQKEKFLNTNKKWLFEEMIFNFSSAIIFCQIPVILINLSNHIGKTEKGYDIFYIILCLILITSILFSYVILFVIPAKAEEYLKQTYPEYGMTE